MYPRSEDASQNNFVCIEIYEILRISLTHFVCDDFDAKAGNKTYHSLRIHLFFSMSRLSHAN